WFIENIERARAGAFRQMGRQLYALRFAAGKRGCRLPQTQVTKSDFVHHAQAIRNPRHLAKEGDRFANRHVQYVVNVLAAITNVQHLLLETRALAFFANQFDIGEKLHLNGDGAVALANFTTAAGHIKRKVRRLQSPRLSFARRGKRFANRVVDLDVRDGIRARRAPDRGLIHEDYFVDMLTAVEL